MLKHPIYATAALLLCLLLPALPAAAQFSIQHSATPLVGKKGAFGVFKKAPKICIPAPKEQLDSAFNVKETYGRHFIPIPIKTNITMENSGKWKTTKTHRVWILEIEATGADMFTVLFDTIYLPENATLCYYTTDKKHLAYPSIINLNRIAAKGRGINLPALNNSGTSSSIIIEYREPIEVNEKKIFVINKIIYEKHDIKKTSFRSVEDLEDATCEVDINCPSGVCWHNEGMGVGRVKNQNTGAYGTGVLLNTIREDGKLYLYTARHTFTVNSTGEVNPLLVNIEFLLKSDACDSPTNYTAIFYPLEAIRAISPINDFALLELISNEDDHKLTYLGWAREAAAAPSPVTCLHHPFTADVSPLRISSSPHAVSTNSSLQPFQGIPAIAANRLWQFVYPVGQRVTHGSSGSPLFDANHVVRGHLVGGESDCEDGTGYTYYGRFDVAWEGEGTPATALKYWLDPDNTNTQSMPTRQRVAFECVSSGSIPQATAKAFPLNNYSPSATPHTYLWSVSGDAIITDENSAAASAEIE